MKKLYATNEWNGYGKQNYYHNEYRLIGDKVVKFKCHRQKTFNGRESFWDRSEKKVDSWNKNDSKLPGWLRRFL